MFNMTYYAHFQYNIYLPVVEGVTYKRIGTVKESYSKAYISDTEYYIGSAAYGDSATAFDANSYWITYEIDGVSYTVELKPTAYLYAMLAIEDPSHTSRDKEATGCLVRYIEESYKAVAGEAGVSEEIQAKFDAFYAKYTPKAYVTEYPNVYANDYTNFEKYIESISFSIYGGSRVALMVTLTDEAVAAGYKIATSGISYGVLKSSNSGRVWRTDNSKLTSIMNNSYTIYLVTPESTGSNFTTVKVDVDGTETALSFKYNLATHIVELENQKSYAGLPKALYAFGQAVKAVRDSIYE